jgi:hypothetical protein
MTEINLLGVLPCHSNSKYLDSLSVMEKNGIKPLGLQSESGANDLRVTALLNVMSKEASLLISVLAQRNLHMTIYFITPQQAGVKASQNYFQYLRLPTESSKNKGSVQATLKQP